MRRATILLALLAVTGWGACEDAIPDRPVDLPGLADMGSGPDFSSTDLASALEFEAFVLGLINTQTADTTKPTPTEDKIFVDSMDPTKFAPLFP